MQQNHPKGWFVPYNIRVNKKENPLNFKTIATAATLTIIGGCAMFAGSAEAYESWTHSTIGGTTFSNGYDYNGNSYSGTTTRIGGSTFHNGYDSNGNIYSGSCSTIGSSTFCNSY